VLEELATSLPDNHRTQRDYAQALRRVGVARFDEDPQHALETLRSSRAVFEQIHVTRPEDDVAHRDLAWGWYYQGWAAMLIPHRSESLDSLGQGWNIVIIRCAANPRDVNARSHVSSYINSAIEICRELDAMDHVSRWAHDGTLTLQPVMESDRDNVALAALFEQLLDIRRQHMATANDDQ